MRYSAVMRLPRGKRSGWHAFTLMRLGMILRPRTPPWSLAAALVGTWIPVLAGARFEPAWLR